MASPRHASDERPLRDEALEAVLPVAADPARTASPRASRRPAAVDQVPDRRRADPADPARA